MRWSWIDIGRRRLLSITDDGNDETRVSTDVIGGIRVFRFCIDNGQRWLIRRRLPGRPEAHDRLKVMLQIGKRVPENKYLNV